MDRTQSLCRNVFSGGPGVSEWTVGGPRYQPDLSDPEQREHHVVGPKTFLRTSVKDSFRVSSRMMFRGDL